METRKLFVIGDSISIHYGEYLKSMTKDKFQYTRKTGLDHELKNLDKPLGANAGDSLMVLDYLKEEVRKNTKYDILLINCGLHDIRVDRLSKKVQVTLTDYKSNLYNIISLAKEMANEVIWVGLTPIIGEIHNARKTGFLRYEEDVLIYDDNARKIMKDFNISYIDLYSFTKSLGMNIYCDHVHFKEDIRRLQAAFIAGYLNSI